jgi:hypothetical protein
MDTAPLENRKPYRWQQAYGPAQLVESVEHTKLPEHITQVVPGPEPACRQLAVLSGNSQVNASAQQPGQLPGPQVIVAEPPPPPRLKLPPVPLPPMPLLPPLPPVLLPPVPLPPVPAPPPPVPLGTQVMPLQLSLASCVQSVQDMPEKPQAMLLGGCTHCELPLQQPLGHDVLLHRHWPRTHCKPAAHGGLAPQPQPPSIPQESTFRPTHITHVLPFAPHWTCVGGATH